MVIIAILAPILGTIADARPIKKRMLGIFMVIGVSAVAAMFFIQRGDWLLAATLFIVANIGANGSFVFYDALLPHIARDDEIDRVSTAGYALGYVGGGLLLTLNLAWIMKPQWFGLPSGPNLTEPGDAPRAALVPLGGRLVDGLRDPPLPEGPRTGLSPRPGGADPWPGEDRIPPPHGDLSPAEALQAGPGHARRVPDLQRRDRHDLPDGGDLRRGDRDRSGGDDRGPGARPVRRDPLRIPLRDAGRMHRGETFDPVLAGRLHGDQRPRLLHVQRDALLPPGHPGRHGPGGEPGAQPLALRQPDPARSVGRVLRLLRGRREVRRHLRAAHVLRDRRPRGVQPPRDPVGDRLLRGRRDSPLRRRRRGGPAHRQGRRGRGRPAA